MTLPRVKADIAYTVNMGDYESLRFNYGLEDDVPEGKTRGETWEKCFDFVWTRLNKSVDEARKAARG